MEYRTRRERREAERAGLVNADETASNNPQPDIEGLPAEVDRQSENPKFPSRRELRARSEAKTASNSGSFETTDSDQPAEAKIPAESSPKGFEEPEQYETTKSDGPITAKSYLYQESSNTFTMDSIPDSLTATNGDLVVTNSESITVVTDSNSTIASAMDDLRYDSEDQKDTVAGKISLVDPVSAKLVADSREPEVIVPGKIVVRNRALSTTFAVLGGVMFVLAGLGLWWVLGEMGPLSS